MSDPDGRPSSPAEPAAEPAAPNEPGRRERNRLNRTRTFLDTAFRIVTAEGFDALTMQRLADETDAAIGAVYRYFPSKGALVAEVQREAIERLGHSLMIIRERSDRQFRADGLEDGQLALTRLMLFGRWFIATADTYPQELRLLQMLIGEWRTIVPPEEGLRVVPSAMRLLDQARQGIDEAMDLGMLDEADDAMSRVVTWAAAVGGVLQLTRLGLYDSELFDGDRLARSLTRDLLVGWGAAPAAIEEARLAVEAVAATGSLAPPIT